MDYNSIKFFLGSFIENIQGLDLDEWTVASLGSGHCNDNWYWNIYLKNSRTKEEKIIRIPCYKD